MKQLELELNKNLLLVEFPGDCYFTWMPDYIFFQSANGHESLRIDGKFKFICMGDKLTEEIAKELVRKEQVFISPPIFFYKDYKTGFGSYTSALQSFISSVETKGFWWDKNPIERPIEDVYEHAKWRIRAFKKSLKNWKEAESRTFNPKQTYIFEKL